MPLPLAPGRAAHALQPGQPLEAVHYPQGCLVHVFLPQRMPSLVCCIPVVLFFNLMHCTHIVCAFFCLKLGYSVDEFYKAKTELLCDKMVIKCEQSSITETHMVIDDLCAKRLVQCLEAFSRTPPSTPAPMAVYELFTQPETLKFRGVMDLVPSLVRGHERSMESLLLRECCVLPSTVVFMTRPEDNVRAFAMSKMTTTKHKITLEEFTAVSPLVSAIVDTICLLSPPRFSPLLFCVHMLCLQWSAMAPASHLAFRATWTVCGKPSTLLSCAWTTACSRRYLATTPDW